MSKQPLIPIEIWEPEESALGVVAYDRKHYVGQYLYCKPSFAWNTPSISVFKLLGDHPLVPMLAKCRRRAIPARFTYNGLEVAGLVFNAECEDTPNGEHEIWTFYITSNLIRLAGTLAWVNPQFPAEVQIGLTGKQDVMFGPLDWVFKWYAARNWIRQDVPCYVKIPVRANNPGLPTLAQLTDLDELLSYSNGIDLIALSARFPYLDELFKQTVESSDIGLSMDLVIPAEYNAAGKPMPMIFNTSGLAQLQSIIDYTSDNFLNVTKLATIPTQWNSTPPEPCYVFDTHLKRDRKHMVWQREGGYIKNFRRAVSMATASHVVVGGQAPEAMNMLIEFAANLVIQAIAAAITTALGLPGLGAVAVGGLFDNIFFAFQHFFDAQLEAELGRHGMKEALGDNTAAWSLNAASVGFHTLREKSGDDTLTWEVLSGAHPDGYEFGADTEVIDGVEVDLSHRRFKCGDEMTFYHKGTFVTNYVSQVDVEHVPGEGDPKEIITFGNNKQKDVVAKIFDFLGQGAAATRALAVMG